VTGGKDRDLALNNKQMSKHASLVPIIAVALAVLGLVLAAQLFRVPAEKPQLGVVFTAPYHTFIDNVAATSSGVAKRVSEFNAFAISIDLEGSTSTVKCAGSVSDAQPNWSAAQSDSNRYDYLDLTDVEDAASIDGDTGFVGTGTTDHRLLYVTGEPPLVWINCFHSVWTSGTTSVQGFFTNH
jgi:hypothetical protein